MKFRVLHYLGFLLPFLLIIAFNLVNPVSIGSILKGLLGAVLLSIVFGTITNLMVWFLYKMKSKV